jgi:hypothetical protein
MKSNRIKLCSEKGCRDEQTTDGFCRFHYLKNWKKLSAAKKKDKEKFEKFAESVAQKYGDDSAAADLDSEIVGRGSLGEQLTEIGISKKVISKEEENPFNNIDIDGMVDNLKYDDDY